ncbi:phosphate-starvation-inducible PsiE family protein [Billgrantia lactosivorans]|uniref:phosphate-starvation-inducible PsiE family protein n=1 Tax=Billgrantia lactosivorans TaxID=2185141 RepID=UPI000DACBD17|nr:phosphate-starvation-inducible PsiE family protein [Halomonas lactosivorans]
MSYYQRFEQIVAIILTLLLSLVVAVAVVHLTWRIVMLIVFGVVDPANQSVFQVVFGMVMTLLIALEFNHSVLSIAERQNSIVQIKTVLLIALLALVRKFIILDATKIDPMTLLGLSAAILALGAIYWLVREQESRQKREGVKRLAGGTLRE